MFVAPIAFFFEALGIAAIALAFGDAMFDAPSAALIVFIIIVVIVVVVGFILGNRCCLGIARHTCHCCCILNRMTSGFWGSTPA